MALIFLYISICLFGSKHEDEPACSSGSEIKIKLYLSVLNLFPGYKITHDALFLPSVLRWVRAVRRFWLCSSIRTRASGWSWTRTWFREATTGSTSTRWPTLPPWGSDLTTCCASWRGRDTNPSWRTLTRTGPQPVCLIPQQERKGSTEPDRFYSSTKTEWVWTFLCELKSNVLDKKWMWKNSKNIFKTNKQTMLLLFIYSVNT